jgi:hypothetical protein
LLRVKTDGGINNKEGAQISDLVHGLSLDAGSWASG